MTARSHVAILALAGALTVLPSFAAATAPRLMRLDPPAGARAADPATDSLVLVFDQPMGRGMTINAADMPEIAGRPAWDSTRTTLTIPVRVRAAHEYRLELNGDDDGGFANPAGERLPRQMWIFRTAGDKAPDDFDDPHLGTRLARRPVEQVLAGGRLQLSHVYVREAQILLADAGQPDSVVVERMVREVYRPYADVWAGYVGDEAAFRWFVASQLLGESHPIRSRTKALLDLDLPALFAEIDAWLARVSGRHPHGRWVLLFGPGSTDMGGIGSLAMVADFTQQVPDSHAIATLLPHELTHQVHGQRPHDPDGATALGRIVAEGLACYAAFVHAHGTRTPAECVGYTPAQWQWALAHERELAAAARPLLDSTSSAVIARLASRSEHLLADGPAAAGYFLGFRLAQRYAARRGAEAWVEMLRLPVCRVRARSGYRF